MRSVSETSRRRRPVRAAALALFVLLAVPVLAHAETMTFHLSARDARTIFGLTREALQARTDATLL